MTPPARPYEEAGPVAMTGPGSQTLSVFQSLWAMENLPWGGDGPRWSLEDRVRRVAEAGFAGLAVDLGAREAPAAEAVAPMLRAAGLRTAVFAFVSPDRPMSAALEYATAVDAELVVVCGQFFPSEVGEAAATVNRWMAEADRAGVAFQLETHRFTLTNDLRFTVRLLDALPGLPIAVDLSHYVVGNEIPDTPDPRVDPLINAVLERGTSFQGRVATRGQVQISPSFPQHRAAVERFRAWTRHGFSSWRQRSAADADCLFVCELGAPPYAITGADGAELTDRWAEALQLNSWAENLFAAAERPENTDKASTPRREPARKTP